jgi:hypothetical protein
MDSAEMWPSARSEQRSGSDAGKQNGSVSGMESAGATRWTCNQVTILPQCHD